MNRMRRKYLKPICPECGAVHAQTQDVLLHCDNLLEWVNTLFKFTNCKTCRNDLPMLYRKVTGNCETCGHRISDHPRCSSCGILAGPGHSTCALIDGQCGSCYIRNFNYVEETQVLSERRL